MPDRIALPPDVFVNRELSWLEFNRRVLEEAQDPTVPLLERVKFLAIFSSNLDEFFMVRVAGLKRRIRAGDPTAGAGRALADRDPGRGLRARSTGWSTRSTAASSRSWGRSWPRRASASSGRRRSPPEQERFLDEYFQRTLMPVLTPLAIDPGHPFPHLANRALCLVVSVRPVTASVLPHASLTVVHIPGQVVPRFVALPGPARPARLHAARGRDPPPAPAPLQRLRDPLLPRHPGHARRGDRRSSARRAEDLLTQRRGGRARAAHGRRGPAAVRPDLPAELLAHAGRRARARPRRPLRGRPASPPSRISSSSTPRWTSRGSRISRCRRARCPAFEGAPTSGARSASGDVLAHHPYHSFDAVTRFVSEAAVDPRVLAIKMTLYRVSPTSPIAQALTRAAENGKEVAVLVELQARFDEEANIRWARALEEVGRPRRLRPARLQDPLQGLPRRPPGAGRDPALLPPRDRQLQRRAPAASTATSGSSPAASPSART